MPPEQNLAVQQEILQSEVLVQSERSLGPTAQSVYTVRLVLSDASVKLFFTIIHKHKFVYDHFFASCVRIELTPVAHIVYHTTIVLTRHDTSF